MSRRSAALIALLFCFACLKEEKPAQRAAPRRPPAAAADDRAPQDGGTLVRRLESDVTTLNPVANATSYDRWVEDYLFTPIIYLGQDLQPVPGLARSWEVLEGGRLYRFELNGKATFSDGTRVKASDVIFTLRKILDPASEALQIVGAFESLDWARTRAIDDDTVEVGFKQVHAPQLIRFNDVMVLPEHVYSKGNFRRDHNFTPVGSGPYRLVRREANKEIVVERRADYWREKPHLERVVFKIVGDMATGWNALRRGDIDESRMTSDVWLHERENPANTKTIDFRRFYTMNYNFIAWNTSVPQLSDRRVRNALAMCVPLDVVVKDLYKNTARAMSGPFTPDDFAYNPTVPVVRHDLTAAKRLLTNAGWLDSNGDGIVDRQGKPLKVELILIAGQAATLQFGQMVQAEMKKIGVQLDLAVLDFPSAIERITNGNYESAYFGFELDPDPDPFNVLHSSQFPPRGQNFAHYVNREVDRLIEQARAQIDRSKRKDLYWRIHEVVAADQPYTYTVQVSAKWGLNRRVKGVEVSRGYGLYRWFPGPLGWWIPRDQRTHDRPPQ